LKVWHVGLRRMLRPAGYRRARSRPGRCWLMPRDEAIYGYRQRGLAGRSLPGRRFLRLDLRSKQEWLPCTPTTYPGRTGNDAGSLFVEPLSMPCVEHGLWPRKFLCARRDVLLIAPLALSLEFL